ncbi:MAG TPA: nucleotidyltransferase domain-containing protein, partial [Burkholderiaceae bacterium]
MHTPSQAMADTPQTLKEDYRRNKSALFDSVRASGPSTRGIHAQLRRLAQLTDDMLRTLWQQAGLPEGFALAAVGGYGRGELFPYSDVDVLLLMPDGTAPNGTPALQARIEGFIGSCWDAGLEIGSSVRTVGECLA